MDIYCCFKPTKRNEKCPQDVNPASRRILYFVREDPAGGFTLERVKTGAIEHVDDISHLKKMPKDFILPLK